MIATVATIAPTQEKLLRARAASSKLALLSSEEKNALLHAIADALEAQQDSILEANHRDLERSGLEGAMRDRLLLNPERIKDGPRGAREVAVLADPIGETLAQWTKLNGIKIRKVRVPLGVMGIIYESRPNVTVDTAVLALKTGNAIVLRGGKEAALSNQRLVEVMNGVAGGPGGGIELLHCKTRENGPQIIKTRGLVGRYLPRRRGGLSPFWT